MIPRTQLEPAWCPLHSLPGPCMYCLGPEVVDLIIERANGFIPNGVLFQQVDQKDN